MDDEIIGLSEGDVAAFSQMWQAFQRRGIRRGDFAPFVDIPQAPEVYIGKVTKELTARGGNKLGKGDCDIYQIIENFGFGTGTGTGSGTGTGTGDFRIVPIFFYNEQVLNLATEPVPAGSLILLIREKGGRWLPAAGSGGGGSRTLLYVHDGFAVEKTIGTACGTGSGTGGDIDVHCGLLFHAADIMELDVECEEYLPTGGCAWVADLWGRRLEPKRMYEADFAGLPPKRLTAIGIPIDPDEPFTPCVPDDDSPLYLVDLGSPARTIFVEGEIGRFCKMGTGSGTGAGHIGGDPAGGGSENLMIYSGTSYIWRSSICAYIPLEPCFVANAHGCPLPVREWVTGAFHRMVPRKLYKGMRPDRCWPLYITTEKKIPRAVGDVRCEDGALKVYFINSDGCEDHLEYGHDAGCCDCGGGGLTGSGTGSDCWCTGKTTSASFTAGTFSLSNGSCLNCAEFPATIPMTNAPPTGGPCVWASTTVRDPCGGSLSASLTVGAGGSADFFIGGGAHDITAHYHLDSGFNCNGSNTLHRVSNGAGCSGWPDTITVAP